MNYSEWPPKSLEIEHSALSFAPRMLHDSPVCWPQLLRLSKGGEVYPKFGGDLKEGVDKEEGPGTGSSPAPGPLGSYVMEATLR